MVDYSKLSDFEINSLVSAHLWGSVCAVDGIVLHNEKDGEFNPCNNPSDAWPIIFENKIMLSPRCADDEWKAEIYLGREDIFDNYASAWHKNPLRAAMIVFLMMREDK